jgi:hypothetical protein
MVQNKSMHSLSLLGFKWRNAGALVMQMCMCICAGKKETWEENELKCSINALSSARLCVSEMQIIKMDLTREEFLSTGAIGSRRFLCSLGAEREATPPVLLNLVAGTQNCNPRASCVAADGIFRSSARLRALAAERRKIAISRRAYYASRSSLNAPRRMHSVGGLICLSHFLAVS